MGGFKICFLCPRVCACTRCALHVLKHVLLSAHTNNNTRYQGDACLLHSFAEIRLAGTQKHRNFASGRVLSKVCRRGLCLNALVSAHKIIYVSAFVNVCVGCVYFGVSVSLRVFVWVWLWVRLRVYFCVWARVFSSCVCLFLHTVRWWPGHCQKNESNFRRQFRSISPMGSAFDWEWWSGCLDTPHFLKKIKRISMVIIWKK